MPITVRILDSSELALLDNVAPDVFDGPVQPRWAAEFCADPRHHLAVALDEEGPESPTVVGMASALHYVHPDKAPELWINEVGVAPTHHRQGIGKRLMATLLAHGRSLGCATAWVLTERENSEARGLYAAAGGVEAVENVVMIEFEMGEDG